MTLIIEDGTKVTGANSYITVAEYEAWVDARFGTNHTGHGDDALVEQYILRAMDYFERLAFRGVKANEDQPLQWPRYNVNIDGYYKDATEIPAEVKTALYELTRAEETSDGLLNEVKRKTKREKIGDIEVEYSDNSSSRDMLPAVTHALRKLTVSPMQVVRV